VISVYTDGSCSPNPGHMGIGAVVKYRDKQIQTSKYLGIGTNNQAELSAIKGALKIVKLLHKRNICEEDEHVMLFTDSAYCIGVLRQESTPKKNLDLVVSIKLLIRQFTNLKIIKVKAHSGVPMNELADKLAKEGVYKV